MTLGHAQGTIGGARFLTRVDCTLASALPPVASSHFFYVFLIVQSGSIFDAQNIFSYFVFVWRLAALRDQCAEGLYTGLEFKPELLCLRLCTISPDPKIVYLAWLLGHT